MRLFRWALIAILITVFGAAIYQTAAWWGGWGMGNDSQVKPLDGNDQEIAFIEPATSIDEWGRLVTSLQLTEVNWPRINPDLPVLKVSLADAFPALSADVPEVVFSFAGNPAQKLRLRWYKITGEHDAASWVRKLRERRRQPLAIVGGGTTGRAIKLAYTLKKAYGDDPEQPAPALIFTTATSEKTTSGKSLIHVYAGRTFRFSFTNERMVEALLQFVERRRVPEEDRSWAHNLWVNKNNDSATLAAVVAGMAGSGDYCQAWVAMQTFPYLQPYAMHAVTWQDERYSQDMTDLFEKKLSERSPLAEFFHENSIRYGVGGFFHPSPQEQDAVGIFLARPTPVTPHSFLLLPTQTVRMRRFLINLRQRSPQDARNLVILNGDAISFHSVYRDRDVTWNILDLPYSLIFFTHRNPIDHSAGFVWTKGENGNGGNSFPPRSTTGTQDVLLYRDIFEALLYAASDKGTILGDPLQVRRRLHATCWYEPPLGKPDQEAARVCNAEVHAIKGEHLPLFDADGDRRSHTGEHIVWVKPNFTGDRVDLTGKISVWSMLPARVGGGWALLEAHDAVYNQLRLEDQTP
ncbi:MAG TPA: hypothetical protein VFE62_17830 [Gemmataceae bacterium]|nr:hypothetical protein [Gemmataceae bacterium]